MNAIVVTPQLRGWGFAPRVNVSHMLRRPRRCALRGEATYEDFTDWMKHRIHEPARIEVMQRFNVSRATAYRWMAMRRQQEAA